MGSLATEKLYDGRAALSSQRTRLGTPSAEHPCAISWPVEPQQTKVAGSRFAAPGQPFCLGAPCRLPARRRFFVWAHGPFIATATRSPEQHVEHRQDQASHAHDDQDQSHSRQRDSRNGDGDGVPKDRAYGDQEQGRTKWHEFQLPVGLRRQTACSCAKARQPWPKPANRLDGSRDAPARARAGAIRRACRPVP